MSVRPFLASVVLVVLTAAPAFPSHGAESIAALAIDPKTPTTVYAGTSDRGVFKSIDGGANWSATGLANIYVSALATDSQAPSVVSAGTDGGAGVFKSADGGGTWTTVGLTGLNGAQLAIDRQTPTTIYALVTANYPLTESPATGVFKSMDAGETWSVTGLIGYHCDCSIGGTSSHGTTLAPQANRALRRIPKCPILVGRQGLEPWTR